MTVKTASEIKLMEKVGRIAAEALQYAGKHVKAGISTNELDQLANDYILSKGATSACIGYHGYPKAICTSVNDVICHGLPDETILKEGDIINIDVTALYQGFHGDTSATFAVGAITPEAQTLVDCAFGAMHAGIKAVKAGNTTGDVGFAVEKFVNRRGFWVVREIGGHGIGRIFHEEPFVPSYGRKGKGPKLAKWGTITVEPMVNQTAAPIREFDIKGSTVTVFRTSDKTLSAQFEHTILITDEGAEILTVC